MSAFIGHHGDDVTAIDLFAGWGGSAQGITKAGATLILAANHDAKSVEVHQTNFPSVEHRRADLSDPSRGDYVDPADLPPAHFLWASPSCKYHSPANARKIYQRGPQRSLFEEDEEEFDDAAYANSERSRVTMLCPLRYAARHSGVMQICVVENVCEAANWGPARDGSTFRWWLREWTKLGYDYQALFLNSMFFPPCPQSRDRMYVVFWRKGNQRPDLDFRPAARCESDRCGGAMVGAVQAWKPQRQTWPIERWGKYGRQYTYVCPRCAERVDPVAWPAYTAIDWSHLGPRIGERGALGMKPLADSTMDRIARCVVKFAGSPPVVIPSKGVWGTDRPVYQPFVTQTTQADKALVTSREGQALVSRGAILPAAGHTYERPGQLRARSIIDQAYTQHTTMSFGFAHAPYLTEMRGGGSIVSGHHPVTDPAHAVTAGGRHHGLITPAMFTKINGGAGDTAWHTVDEPFNTITSRDTTGLVVLPWIDQWRSNPAAVTEQLATVMTHMRHALASIEAPALDRVSPEDLAEVRFRMLEPETELRRICAFDDDYILLGSKSDKTCGLGNAVTPTVSTWITSQCLETLAGRVIAA